MEWNMDKIRAQVAELNKMDTQQAYIEMPDETREFYDAVMEEVYSAVCEEGYTLEPSTQMGRGTVAVWKGDYETLLCTTDFQVETRAFLDLVDAEMSFEEIVKSIADGYVELARDNEPEDDEPDENCEEADWDDEEE